MSDLLQDKFRVCAVDHPGSGFSDKPHHPFRYSIFDHAKALDFFLRSILKVSELILLSHDEGDSVAFQLLASFVPPQGSPPPYKILYQFILNGGIYLPKAHLSDGQKRLLSNETGPVYQKLISVSFVCLTSFVLILVTGCMI